MLLIDGDGDKTLDYYKVTKSKTLDFQVVLLCDNSVPSVSLW